MWSMWLWIIDIIQRYNSKFKVSMMASSEVGCYPSKRNFPIDFPIGISVKGTMFWLKFKCESLTFKQSLFRRFCWWNIWDLWLCWFVFLYFPTSVHWPFIRTCNCKQLFFCASLALKSHGATEEVLNCLGIFCIERHQTGFSSMTFVGAI